MKNSFISIACACLIIIQSVPALSKNQIQWHRFQDDTHHFSQIQHQVKARIQDGEPDPKIIRKLKQLQSRLINKWKTQYIQSIDSYYQLTAVINDYEQHEMIKSKLDQLQKRIDLEKYLFSMEIKTVSESIVAMKISDYDHLHDDLKKVKLALSANLRQELATCYHPYQFITDETIVEQGFLKKHAIIMEQGCVVQVNNAFPPLSFKVPGKLILIRSFRILPNLNVNPEYPTQENVVDHCQIPKVLNNINDFLEIKKGLNNDEIEMIEVNKKEVHAMINHAKNENIQSQGVLQSLTTSYQDKKQSLVDDKKMLLAKQNRLWDSIQDRLSELNIQIDNHQDTKKQLQQKLTAFAKQIQATENNREMIFYSQLTEFNAHEKPGFDFINELIPHEYSKLRENMKSMNHYSSSKVIGGTLVEHMNQNYMTKLHPVEFALYCWHQVMPKMEDRTFKDVYTIVLAIKAKSLPSKKQPKPQAVSQTSSPVTNPNRIQNASKNEQMDQNIYKDSINNKTWIKLKTKKTAQTNRFNYKRAVNYDDLLRLVSRANDENTYGHKNWKIPSVKDFQGLDFQKVNIQPGEWYWTSTVVDITRDKVKIVQFNAENGQTRLVEDVANKAYDYYYILFLPE